VKKQSEAIAILERLRKGENFANLAKELSIDKRSAKGGGVGFIWKTNDSKTI
jgi:peptidyl-prolyl cis-trans isomerase C